MKSATLAKAKKPDFLLADFKTHNLLL